MMLPVLFRHVLGIAPEPKVQSMEFEQFFEGTDELLLIDASNAFNHINRLAGMHNIRITCPEVSLYINTYRYPSRLFKIRPNPQNGWMDGWMDGWVGFGSRYV